MRLACPVVLSLLLLPAYAQNQSPNDWREQLKSGATLGTVRRLFSNQRVIVGGPVVNFGRGSVLLEWTVARTNGDERYVTDVVLDDLSARYKGKTATVIAVQLNETRRRDLQPNALGETVAADDIPNPYFDLVVRFEDETLAMHAAFPGILSEAVELASAATAINEQMSTQLPLIVGKTVYAVGYSKLYQPDTTLEELTGLGSSGALKQLSPHDVRLLEPLTIVAAKYLDNTGVVLKLRMPDGKEALSFTGRVYYLDGRGNTPCFDSVIGALVSEIPKKLTPQEVDAIKHRTIYKGMTKDAIDYLLGFSEKTNNWGRGGKQVIYFSGRIVVYLDNDDKVDDWQSFEK
jgi:hypothetical protein